MLTLNMPHSSSPARPSPYVPLPAEPRSLAVAALGPGDRRAAELADLIEFLAAEPDSLPRDYPGVGAWRD